jgi:molybdopterin-containing oxidoreductase family iron-sulfur binding subunit
MDATRRGFLKQAGATTLGLSCASLLGACGRESQIVGQPWDDAKKGKRWAIVVDLKKCREPDGCIACIDACHSTHNVPEIEDERRQLRWIWKEPFETAFPDLENEYASREFRETPTLLLCNHCDHPPCVRVCPTQATWRRDDGVVMMDMHRCIGCRYCMAACPYGSRSFNWSEPWASPDAVPNPNYPKRTKGVVEKCNLCAERLARGEIPMCVEKCPHDALTFGDAADESSKVFELLHSKVVVRRKSHLGTYPHVFYLV